MRDWKESSDNCSYYFETDTGLIVSQINQVAHTKIWLAKCFITHNDERYLGQFVSQEFAKQAVERFWGMKERTLEHDQEVGV